MPTVNTFNVSIYFEVQSNNVRVRSKSCICIAEGNLMSSSSRCQPLCSCQTYLSYAEGAEWSCQMTNSNGTVQLTRAKQVITVNRPDMRSVVAWWSAVQCVMLCQVLNHSGYSVGAEESRWLNSSTEQWMLLKAWTDRLLSSAVAALPVVLLAGR